LWNSLFGGGGGGGGGGRDLILARCCEALHLENQDEQEKDDV